MFFKLRPRGPREGNFNVAIGSQGHFRTIGCFIALQRSLVEGDLGLELKEKVWGQILKNGSTFLSISLLKTMCYRKPSLWARRKPVPGYYNKNYNISLRKTFSVTTGSLKLVKDLEWFLDKWNVISFGDSLGGYYMSCSILFIYFGLTLRSSAQLLVSSQ